MIGMLRSAAVASAIALLAISGCATSGPAISAATLSVCAADGAPDGWRQVVSAEVRFCVPPSWTSRGSESWVGDGGEITWGTTRPRSQIRSTITTVRGSEPPTEQQIRDQLGMREIHRGTETIGGAQVELWITTVEGEFFTGATWRSGGSFFMSGGASSESAARDHLAVYRTARRGGAGG